MRKISDIIFIIAKLFFKIKNKKESTNPLIIVRFYFFHFPLNFVRCDYSYLAPQNTRFSSSPFLSPIPSFQCAKFQSALAPDIQ